MAAVERFTVIMGRRLAGLFAAGLAVLAVVPPAAASPQTRARVEAREALIQRLDARREAREARKEAEKARMRAKKSAAPSSDVAKPAPSKPN